MTQPCYAAKFAIWIPWLQEFVKGRTAPYKYPRDIEFVDSLPKTVSGKIMRNVLRKRELLKQGG